MNKNLVAGSAIVILTFVGLTLWLKPFSGQNGRVVCTLEAKLCPDGSSVGRIGPLCQFAACPNEATTTASLEMFNDQKLGVSFKYPANLGTRFILTDPQSWPPTVTLATTTFSCVQGQPTVNGLPTQKTKKVINGKIYCVETDNEGAAGTMYSTYTYTTLKNAKLVSLTFTVRYPQCDNYDDPNKTECKNERQNFNLDQVIDAIVTSLEFK